MINNDTVMAVSNLQVLDIIEVMEAFLQRRRRPEYIRPKLDIGYRVEGQNISFTPSDQSGTILGEYSIRRLQRQRS